jgi:N-acetylglucosaminyldiphosphoundecaprenol N-acetyl-beta-D-mannosaminyltransferase
MPERFKIISLNVHCLSFKESLELVMQWALNKRPAYVCFANVHMTIEAYRDPSFADQVNNADLVLADGKPLANELSHLCKRTQERISGMDFTPRILKMADEKKLSIFIYGSTENVIKFAKEKININYPNVQIAGSISPPFRKMTEDEITKDIKIINESAANIILVALGCPKQEKWMAENSNKINAVLLGVGAALPVLAGIEKRAPGWMQEISLEWFYRLIQQPKRLFTRYLYTNSYFLFLLGRERMKPVFKKNADQDK